ncbi:GGDEF domain-containing protein [bacterium]|nr:GGDEF domain-containing protein [bacterium]UNM07594.1 MAG: GGDEF domain-containing protein [Planctomycetales bacterium]
MILVFSNNDDVVNGVHAACESGGLEFEWGHDLTRGAMEQVLSRLQVLVIDLTCATMSCERVLGVLDGMDSADIPPVLYLLSSPSDLDHITEDGSIVNVDYAFLPVDPAQIAPRLQVLYTLGQRRRRSMETAITDRLTGLYNRKYFLRRLDEEMYRTTRYNNDVGVLLVDIDFEIPGGQLTENTASDLLPQIAEFFQDRLRRSDIVARYKWSQVALLLPEIGAQDCEALAMDIHQKLHSHHWGSGNQEIIVQPTVSWLLFPVENLGSSIEVMSALEDSVMHGRSRQRGVISYVEDAGVMLRSI